MQIEMTDTFGGEANYSWVKRATLNDLPENCTDRQLLKAIRNKFELPTGLRLRKVMDCGDFKRWDIQGACICIMASWEY